MAKRIRHDPDASYYAFCAPEDPVDCEQKMNTHPRTNVSQGLQLLFTVTKNLKWQISKSREREPNWTDRIDQWFRNCAGFVTWDEYVQSLIRTSLAENYHGENWIHKRKLHRAVFGWRFPKDEQSSSARIAT